MLNRLEKYCNTFGPSGMEDEVRRNIIADIDGYCEYSTDRVGNLICFKKGKNTRSNRVVLCAHMDELGVMVDYVTPEGLLHFGTIGGIESKDLCGKYMVLGEKQLPAVIGSKAIHNQKPEERGMCPPINQLYMDIGACDKADAMKYADVGDCAVFRPNFKKEGNFVSSKALDDRFGCAALVEIIRGEIEYDTYFVFATAEEVGSRGAQTAAYRLGADYAIICEATAAGEEKITPPHLSPCTPGEGAVISVMDGGTIYDREFVETAEKLAKENDIKYQLKRLPTGSNDSRMFQTTLTGAKVLAVSAPTRYIHSPCNVCRTDDMEQVVKLLKVLTDRSYE